MARRGRPPKSPRAVDPGSASDAPVSANTTVSEEENEASTDKADASPSVRNKRAVAVTNIRCNAGDLRPGDVLPDNVVGLDRLIEVGAAKFKAVE